MIERLKEWAAGQEGLRSAILVGSRARPRAVLDAWSDYDVLLFFDDPEAWLSDDAWLADLGDPLLVLPERYRLLGSEVPTRLVQYREGHRIDFTLSTGSALRVIAYLPELPPMLDTGYTVLWDRDGITGSMCPPQGRGFAGRPPDPDRLAADLREFLWEALVVAKALLRGESHAAAYSGEAVMRHRLLRELLEVRARMASGWMGDVGPVGKGLDRWLPEESAERAAAAPGGWQGEAGWRELEALLDLHADVAAEVCGDLGVQPPDDEARWVRRRIAEMRESTVG